MNRADDEEYKRLPEEVVDAKEQEDKQAGKNPALANCLMHIHTISTSGMWLYVKLAMTL